MSDYGTMQARIASELRRNNISDQIKNAIQTAIALAEVNRYYFNEARATTETENTKAYYAVPTDFQNMESLTITVNNSKYPLEPRTFQYIDGVDIGVANTGIPIWYAVYNQQFRLYPVPDAAYTLTLAYQKKLETLENDGDTNAWMTDGEIMVRQMAKAVVLRDVIRGEAAMNEANTYESAANRARDYLKTETTRRTSTGNLIANGYPQTRRHYW
jgi:hypothetical protein